ncbi:UNVERIFIED_CONTAM: hypothetical protein GTU68_012606 [Idotea baltica]|nr:hypothetical protein [Idotea baltica]
MDFSSMERALSITTATTTGEYSVKEESMS